MTTGNSSVSATSAVCESSELSEAPLAQKQTVEDRWDQKYLATYSNQVCNHS